MKKIKGGAAIDSIMLTVVRVIVALISIIIYKMTAVTFSLEEYGLYSQAMLVATTITSITILGMTDAVNYFYNKEKDTSTDGRVYVQTIFLLQFIIGIIFAVLIVIFKGPISLYFGNENLSNLIPYIALVPLLTNILNMLQILFVSNRKTKIIAIRNFVLSIIKVVFVAIVCYFMRDVRCLLITTLIIDAISVIYMLVYCAKNIFVLNPREAKLYYSKEIFLYCIPMAAYVITNALSRNIDKLIIGWYGDAESLALYTIASKEMPFDMLTTSFMTVLIPYITRFIVNKDYEQAGKSFSNYIQISYSITWIVGFGAIFLSDYLMPILYDSKYLPASNIFRLYMIVDMIKFANTSLIFSATAKTKELLIYSFGALVVNLFLNILFYNMFGLIGPAIATVVVTLVLTLLLFYRSTSILKSKFVEILNFRRLCIILIEAVGLGFLALYFVESILNEKDVLIKFVLGYVTYFVPMILLNFKSIIKLLKLINREKLT